MAIFDKDKTIQGLGYGKEFVPGELNATGNVQWDTDTNPEFILDINSERYKACLEEARRLRVQFPLDKLDPKNPDQFKTIVNHEQAIVTALNDKIHEQYGDYNEAIAKGADSATHPSMHDDIVRQNKNTPASLAEFKKDELICRHFAPLASALLTEAGVPNFSVGCNFDEFKVVGGKITHDVNPSGQDSNAHITVISRLTGNMIEPTAQSSKDGGKPYKRNVNGVPIEEIVAGKTVISSSGSNQFQVYSTGFFNDAEQQKLLDKRLAKIRSGEHTPDHHNPYAGNTTTEQHNQTRKSVEAKITAYNANLVQSYYQDIFKPLEKSLNKALEEGNIEAVTKSLESFPVSQSKLTEAFNSAVDAKHLPLAQFLADKGAFVSKGKMAGELTKAIGNQGNPDALKLAEFAIDHGATEGFSSAPKKEEFPFWVKLSDKNGVKEKFDQDFTIGLVKKLGVTPETYFKEAVEYRWEEHIKASLAYIESSDKKQQMRPALQRAAEELKAANFTSRAELITAALAETRDSRTLVASVDQKQPVLQRPKPTKVPKIEPVEEQIANNTPKPSDTLSAEQQKPLFLNEANPIKINPPAPKDIEIRKSEAIITPMRPILKAPPLPPISLTPSPIKRAEQPLDLSMPKVDGLGSPKKPAELKPLEPTPVPLPEKTTVTQSLATEELKPRSVDAERKDKTKTNVVTASVTTVTGPVKTLDEAAEAKSKQMEKAIAAVRKLDIGRDQGIINGSITTKVNGVAVPDGKIGINELAKISDKATSGYDWVQNEKSAAQQARKGLIASMDLNRDGKTSLEEAKEVMKEAQNKGLSFDENALMTTLRTGSIPNKTPNPTLKK